jgi:hypothetical protein
MWPRPGNRACSDHGVDPRRRGDRRSGRAHTLARHAQRRLRRPRARLGIRRLPRAHGARRGGGAVGARPRPRRAQRDHAAQVGGGVRLRRPRVRGGDARRGQHGGRRRRPTDRAQHRRRRLPASPRRRGRRGRRQALPRARRGGCRPRHHARARHDRGDRDRRRPSRGRRSFLASPTVTPRRSLPPRSTSATCS